MPLSNEEKRKLEQAFQDALNLENNGSNHGSGFDQGIEQLLPNLYSTTFSQDSQKYEGTVFNQYKINITI